MRCLLTYQSRHWWPSSPSIPQSLPVEESSWLPYPAHYPEAQLLVLASLLPSSSGPYVTCHFKQHVSLGPGCPIWSVVTCSPSCLLTWPGSIWTLPDVSISTCFLPYICNKNLNPQEQSVMSSFYFFFSFSSQIMPPIPRCFLVHCLC